MRLTLIVILLLFALPCYGVVLFEDNFNEYSEQWSKVAGVDATSSLFPWTTNEGYDPSDPDDYGNGGGVGISDYEPSPYAQGARTNANSWNGWVLNNSGSRIDILTTSGYTGGCLRYTVPQINGLSGETGIQKWLGNTQYQELYLSYRFKFTDTWQWNGTWTEGYAADSPGIIWKLGRVWTGFNPMDYDKTGGQSQPVEDTTWTNESNWRAGIWIWRWLAGNDWGVTYTPFFSMAHFYWAVSCTPPASPSTCDSQSDPRTTNVWDFADAGDTGGQLNTHLNSGNNINSDGTWTDSQDWHQIEMYFKNCTDADTEDGDFALWIDGVERTDFSITNTIFPAMVSGDYGLNFVRINDNFNNLTTNIGAENTQLYYVDDVVISTTYIGPDYEIGGSTASPSTVSGGTVTGVRVY